MSARQGSYGTPHCKKQRLFSPTSPSTPDEFDTKFHPSNLFSHPSPCLSDSFDTSVDSMNGSLGHSHCPIPEESYGMEPGDVMMRSPPRIERLQLFDSPRTPASIARSSGIHVSANSQNQPHTNRQPKRPNSWSRYMISVYFMLRLRDVICMLFGSRVKRANRITRSGPELRRRPSRGTNINPFTPREVQGRSRNGDLRVLNQEETWASTPQSIREESKPQKVPCSMCL